MTHTTNSKLFAALALTSALALVGCSKDGEPGGSAGVAVEGDWAAHQKVIAAWKAAGLETGAFEKVDAAAFGGGQCETGTVAGVEATLCQHPSADQAQAVQGKALKKVGDTTGFAITKGELVLVVADRGKRDPSGKTLNKLAKTFQAL